MKHETVTLVQLNQEVQVQWMTPLCLVVDSSGDVIECHNDDDNGYIATVNSSYRKVKLIAFVLVI